MLRPLARGSPRLVLRADGQNLCSAHCHFDTNSVYHMMTGVDRDYRGRKLALKLLAIDAARAAGAAYMRTNHDSKNAPMLAVNRKLGYQPQPGKYLLLEDC